MDILGSVAIALLTGGGLTALLHFAQWWIQHQSDVRARAAGQRIPELFEDVHDVYAALNELQNELNASRVHIFAITNGGLVPQLGAKLYASVLYETVSTGTERVKDRIQKHDVDEEHVSLLLSVARTGKTRVWVAHLEEGTWLYRHAQASGISEIWLYRLFTNAGRFVYLSVEFTHPKESTTFSAQSQNRLDSLISELRRTFKEHYSGLLLLGKN